MCGIIGQLAFGELNEKEEKIRQESMIFFGSELLQLTQERGSDATGVALLFRDGNYIGLKMGIPAIEFIARFGKTEKEYGGIIKVWRKNPEPVKTFLGHCRKVSRGSALNNNNNHPIKIGDVIGIHNGTVENDDKVFKNLDCKRDGQVDSEAIFRLLHHYTKNGTEPFTLEMMKETVQRLDGSYAVLAMSGNNPYQVCCFRDKKPVDIVLIKPLHLVICASEKKHIETAIFRYNKFINLYMGEGNFPTITKDDVEYKYMADDAAVIFDLRTKINGKTELPDLYDWESMPRTIIHGYSRSYTAPSHGFSGNSGVKKDPLALPALPTTPERGVSVTDLTGGKTSTPVVVKTETGDKSGACGRVFNKKARKFVSSISEDQIEKGKETGGIEVDVDRNKIEEVIKFKLPETEDADTNILSERAAIKELPAPKSERMEVELIDSDGNSSTVEVDVTVNTEAVEAAEEEVKRAESFKTTTEVLAALEIADEETLKVIPVTALANRMKKVFLRAGYIKGFSAGSRVDVPEERNKVAEEHIRFLKAFIPMYDNILRFSGVGCRPIAIERAITQVLDSGRKLSQEAFESVFSTGDERNSEVLRVIKEMIINKSNR